MSTQHASKRRSAVCASMTLAMLGALLGPLATSAAAAPSQNSYIIAPHPDDEYSMWSLIRASSANYKVFIFMTQGEESAWCKTTSTNGFQGPRNLGNQYDHREINPISTGFNVWRGRWTQTCKNARILGTNAFIRQMASQDPAVPNVFNYRGDYYGSGNTSDGVPPRRDDNGITVVSRRALVYDAANAMGKVIFFDLGDGDLQPAEVAWALNYVRSNKTTLGIPNLPEYNVLGAFSHKRQWDPVKRQWLPPYGNCLHYDHPDHRAVHDALWSQVSGRRNARTCSTDPDMDSSRTSPIPPGDHSDVREMNGLQRIGPFQRRYGWLDADYWEAGWGLISSDQIRARTQYWWTRN